MERDLFDPPAIVQPADALAELAGRINAEHRQAETALRVGLAHARNAGQLLLEAKKQVAHGQWLPWLQANVSFSERTAQAYMRIAKRWDELEAKAQHVADLPYRDGLKLLAEPPPSSSLQTLHDAVKVIDQDNAALKAGHESTDDLEPTFREVREALPALRERIDAPDVTVEELLSIRSAAEAVELASAENMLRVERKLGQLLAAAGQLPVGDILDIPIELIQIGQRIRQDLGDLDRLADSMRNLGLLTPIVVTPDCLLAVGRRRLEAAKILKWKTIAAMVLDVDPLIAERDENCLRENYSPLAVLTMFEKEEALRRERGLPSLLDDD